HSKVRLRFLFLFIHTRFRDGADFEQLTYLPTATLAERELEDAYGSELVPARGAPERGTDVAEVRYQGQQHDADDSEEGAGADWEIVIDRDKDKE
ncbi:hypothetical protein FB451DRAFT_1149386, partial [Mycena latifolia]